MRNSRLFFEINIFLKRLNFEDIQNMCSYKIIVQEEIIWILKNGLEVDMDFDFGGWIDIKSWNQN